MTTWRWVDIFSEGGPFLIAAEPAFRDWPGDAGWDDALAELEAPGHLYSFGPHTVCLFDPEDSGPAQVGWTRERLVVVRWSEQGNAPIVFRDLDAAGRASFDAVVRAALDTDHDELESFGAIEHDGGPLVISWAPIAGADVDPDPDTLTRLAATDPRETLRFRDGAPALTAVALAPGRYAVSGMFDFYDEPEDRGGTWVELRRLPAD